MKSKGSSRVLLLVLGCYLLGSTLGVAGAAEAVLTLDAAVAQALRANPDLQLTLLEYDLAERKRIYQEGSRPGLDLSATMLELRVDADKLGTLPQPGWDDLRHPRGQLQLGWDVTPQLQLSAGVSFSSKLHEPTVTATPSLKVAYTQSLFAPRVPQVELAYGPVARTAAAVAQNQLARNVSAAFLNLLKRQQEAALLRAELEIARAKLLRASTLGLSTADVLRAEGDVDTVQDKLLQGEEAVYTAQQSLLELTALPSLSGMDLVFDIEYAPLGDSPEQWLELGVKASSAVADAAQRLQEAEQKLLAHQRDHGWAVTFNASYEAQRWAEGSKPANRSEQEVRASLAVRNTLWPKDPFTTEELTLAVRKAEVALENALARAQKDVEALFRSLQSTQARIVTLYERLAEAQSALAKELRRISAGLATELERKEVELVVQGIEMDLTHAYYDHFLARLDLMDLCAISFSEVRGF